MLLIKHDKSFHHLYLLIVLLLLMKLAPGFISGVKGATFGCIERERQALLKFKDGLIDNSGLLSTWGSEEEKRDCCKWRGVGCNNRTGHVTHLDLSGFNLSQTIDWLQVPNRLPRLHELLLRHCSLSIIGSPSLSLVNPSKSLAIVDFSFNDLSSSIFHWLANFGNSLVDLDLSHNHLQCSIPDAFTNMTSLRTLNLSSNQLQGDLSLFGRICSLNKLYISENKLTGELSQLFGCVENSLEILQLDGNQLHGSLPDITRFTSMRELNLSWNQLNGSLTEQFSQRSELVLLYLNDNQLTGSLTDVAMLSSLRELVISNNPLDGNVSESIGSLFQLEKLHVGGNSLQGPASFRCDVGIGILRVLDLSNNVLTGSIPDCLSGLAVLNLASNNFSGKIPSSIGSTCALQTLSLHNNSFVGELPLSLRNCSSLVFLDLSSNKLRGEIPGWIGESMPSLKILSLQSNGFSGSIPPNLCHLSNILILDLSINNISGIIPKCLNNLTSMVQKTESEYSLANNAVLSRSYWTPTYDVTPYSSDTYKCRCNFAPYQRSDTDGSLDRSCCSSSPYQRPDGYIRYQHLYGSYVEYQNEIRVGWKGRADDYRSTLGLLRIIDFARNKLVGEIPEEITGLSLLLALNLSGNNLTGEIPQKIGQLKQLESLDLSGNQLSGVIPITMADLTFLSYLNLSNNHLSGPSSTQLQGFNASQFTGNLALCGQPLLQKCPGDETNQCPPANDDNRGQEVVADEFMKWFCTAMGIGFSVFFWGVSGALLLKRSWRHAYFRFLDESWDWLYVKVAVRKARLQREFQRLREHVLA